MLGVASVPMMKAMAVPRGKNRAPVIGVTCHLEEGRASARVAYAQAVARAGGTPVMLPPVLDRAGEHVSLCDGFVLTGGDDPLMEAFGQAMHPKAAPVDPERQDHELALLNILKEQSPDKAVLGVCLGMQYMALYAGGGLNQHMPDDTPTHDLHKGDKPHNVRPVVKHEVIAAGLVTSHHKQAVTSPGSMRVVAVAEDGVIEAIDDPDRKFYIGVQWHPERTPSEQLGQHLFEKLVQCAGA